MKTINNILSITVFVTLALLNLGCKNTNENIIKNINIDENIAPKDIGFIKHNKR
jgi:hypothetical protein